MSDVFISYARSTARQAQQIAEALRGQGYSVWIDDELPAHRAYTDVIEERLRSAKAVVVIWSAEAVKSHWVRAEATAALEAGTLVQLSLDGVMPPMPFSQIQCADMDGWVGEPDAPGWRKIAASIIDLLGGAVVASPSDATAPLPLPSKPSIAVLPFANLSGDAEQEYFADGMVEEITRALSRIRSIFVIAGGSSLSLKGKGVSPQDAARQLGVRFVLEGSVRTAGGRVRIAARLIDAADGAQIWADRFEDTLEDVFALQDRVALSVAAEIEPTVAEAEIRRVSARPTDNMGSYDLYLRAVPLMRSYLTAPVLEAIELLNRATALDPDYGSALGLASTCHYLIVTFGWSDDLDSHRRHAVELMHRALKAGRDDAYVLAPMALPMADIEGDLEAAIALANRAIALNPGSTMSWLMSGAIRMRTGDADLASEHIERAMRLAPLGPFRPTQVAFLAHVRLSQRRFAEAITLAKEYVQQTDSPMGYAYLASSFGHLGQTGAALDALAKYRARSPQPIEVFARSIMHDPAHLQLFLDGIALAERNSPGPEQGGI